MNKRGVSISAVPPKDFEQGGKATVVRHGFDSWFTGWHPPADEPWKVIERTESLLRLQPRLPYNLIGHNCEIIANMCASGGWTESYQARRYFAVRVVTDAALQFWVADRGRAKLPLPKWVLPVVSAGVLAITAPPAHHLRHPTGRPAGAASARRWERRQHQTGQRAEQHPRIRAAGSAVASVSRAGLRGHT